MTLARYYERKSIALATCKKHLTFNHVLKSHGVLSPSLSFTPPIRTKAGYKIARKADLKYLRLRITHCHNNIMALTSTLHELTVKLESKLSREHLRALQETAKQSTTATSERVSQTHAKKFNKLINNKKRGRSPPIVDKEKWVVHVLLQRTLGPVEITALEKGFNFSIAPKTIPVAKILSSVENGSFSLSQSAKDTIRVSIANILKNCKVPSSTNMTKAQETALLNLRKDESVKVLPADKGRSIVVMDSDECKEKEAVSLNDAKSYLKLTDRRLNPTSSVEKDLNKILHKIMN